MGLLLGGRYVATYDYMSNAELSLINQEKMKVSEADDPIFKVFPTVNKNTSTVKWQQRDNYKGLQAIRGQGGQFVRVNKTPTKEFVLTPGYYGEYAPLDEKDLTDLREPGTFGTPANVDNLIAVESDKLIQRKIDRKRQMLWTLAVFGAVSIANEFGDILYAESYSPQAFTPSVAWSTLATSIPLQDLRNVKLLARGKGVRFDKTATVWVNQQTMNNVMNNTNTADLGKKLVNNGSNINSMGDVNAIFLANDLPQLAVWDDGYFTETGITIGGVTYNIGDFVPFIPNTKGLLVGNRIDGSTIGEYVNTRNAQNPNSAPGDYNEIVQDPFPPRTINVYMGNNGAPALYYPGSLVILNI
jgi:hypothetical protein